MTIDLSGWRLVPVTGTYFPGIEPASPAPISLSDLIASHNKLAEIQAAYAEWAAAEQAIDAIADEDIVLEDAWNRECVARAAAIRSTHALAREPIMEKINV